MLLSFILLAAAAPQALEAVPSAVQAEQGVIAYPPAFFAEARPTSAFDMVARLPGFTFDKGASVRGLAGASGNVLIDGQPPVSKNDGLDEILKRIPAGSVERVELIRGGAPGVDMDGRSVLANVVRKKAAGFRAAVTPSMNFTRDHRVLNSLRAEAQWRWPGGRSAELSQVLSSSAFEEFGQGGRVRYNANGTVRLRSTINSDATRRGYQTTGAFETPLAGGQARLNAAVNISPFSSELYDRYVGGGKEYEYNTFLRKQIEVGGRFSRALNTRTSLEAVALQQSSDVTSTAHFDSPTTARDFRLERTGDESVGRLTLKFRQSPRLSFEASAEGALNRLDSVTSLLVNGKATVVPAANVQIEEQRAEATLRGTWRASDALTLEAGLRQEVSRTTSKGDVITRNPLRFTKPRISLAWAATPDRQLRLRVEREVGQLNFEDFVASSTVASTGTLSTGNPNLTPQQAWVAEATFEQRFWTAGAVVLTARRSELSDVVDRVPVYSASGAILSDSPGNIGKGRRDELQASLTLPLDKLGVPATQIRAQITRRWSRVDDPLTGRSREISTLRLSGGRDSERLSPVTWDAHLIQEVPRLNAVWGIDVIGAYRDSAYRLTEIETKKVGTQATLFTEYRPKPNLTLRAEAQLFNQRDVKRIREVYAGARSLGVLDYTDVRNLEWGGSLFFSVRRSFGG